MRFPVLTLLLAFCFGLASGCSEGVTRRTTAAVLSVKGDVVFETTEQNKFQPVTRESRIQEGSIVRTSDGALLDLGLIAPALAQMSSNSEIKVEELRISKDGNQTRGGMRGRSARIQLSRGKITVLVSGRDQNRTQFAISTPAVRRSRQSQSGPATFNGGHQLVRSRWPRLKMPRRKSILWTRSELKMSCSNWTPVGGIAARFSKFYLGEIF